LKLAYCLVIFLFPLAGFCDMAGDISTFFQEHANMFQEILKRYNDKGDYKYKPIAGQKYVSARVYPAKRKQSAMGEATEVPVGPDPPVVFTSKTAWADLKATVINYHTHFQVRVESSSPAEKWFLEKDDTNHTVISSGGLNDQYNFLIDQPGNFVSGQMNLRIINLSDGNQYPSLFPLK